MEVAAQIGSEGTAEFLNKSEREVLGVRGVGRGAELQLRPVTQVDDGPAQGLIHGNIGVSVAADSGFVTQRLLQAFAEDDAGVFDGVVEIDFDIAVNLEIEVDEGVPGEEGQHVIEEWNPGLDCGASLTIEVDAHLDFGLCGIPFPGGSAVAHDICVLKGADTGNLTGFAVGARMIVSLIPSKECLFDEFFQL